MSKIHKTDAEWREELTEEQYSVLRQKGTEIPFSGKFVTSKETGIYSCAACGATLFSSEDKYDSTTPGLIGWPSFSEVVNSDSVKLQDDDSLGMHRVEAMCTNCGSHIGHLFEDESSPNGKHFCINSVSLDFQKQTADDKDTN